MNLLLLLSALLSALTGIGGTRAGATPAAVCARSVEVRAARTVAVALSARPAQALPTLAAVRIVAGAPLVLAAIEPAFASRRRE